MIRIKLDGNGGHHRSRMTRRSIRQCECGSPSWSVRHVIVETLRDVAITVTRLDL